MNLYLPVVLMVVCTTLYHLAQKSVPSQVNPMFSLMMNYLSALVGTLILVPLFPARTADAWSWRSINWASCAVGAAIVGIELSVLLAQEDQFVVGDREYGERFVTGGNRNRVFS